MITKSHPGDYTRRVQFTEHKWNFCPHCGDMVIAPDGNKGYCANHKWITYFSMLETEAAKVMKAFQNIAAEMELR